MRLLVIRILGISAILFSSIMFGVPAKAKDKANTRVVCKSLEALQQIIDNISNESQLENWMYKDADCEEYYLYGNKRFYMTATLVDSDGIIVGPGITCLEEGCTIHADAAAYAIGTFEGRTAYAIITKEFGQSVMAPDN